MKTFNTNKKLRVLVAAFLIVFSTVFSCCLKGEAQTSIMSSIKEVKHRSHHCCSQQDNNHKMNPDKCHSCNCAYRAKATFDVKDFNFNLNDFFQSTTFCIQQFVFIDQNQQQLKYPTSIKKYPAIPIYLHLSTLRI